MKTERVGLAVTAQPRITIERRSLAQFPIQMEYAPKVGNEEDL